DPGSVAASLAANEERDTQAAEATGPGDPEGCVQHLERLGRRTLRARELLAVLPEGLLGSCSELWRQLRVARAAHELPGPADNRGARVEQLFARTSPHLVDEPGHHRGPRGDALSVEESANVGIEQGVAELERPTPVDAHLAAAENEARQEAQHVEPPGADEGIVEVVQIEDDTFLGVALARLGHLERPGSIGAEVLEMNVAREPPFARGAFAERGESPEDLVEERRRAPEERERRHDHARGLVSEEVREVIEASAVDLDLSAGEANG